jgi:MscS family membrane protein
MPSLFQTLPHFFDQEVAGNAIRYWGLWLLILVLGLVTKQFVSSAFSKLVYKVLLRIKAEDAADPGNANSHGVLKFYQQMHSPLEALFTWFYIYIAFTFLVWPPALVEVLSRHFDLAAVSSFLYRTALIGIMTSLALRLMNYFVETLKVTQTQAPAPKVSSQALMFLKEAGRIGIFIVAFLVFLGLALGRDVGAVISGLGISGLAIAFAAKETLENLIASVIIFVDKPFSVGDFVELGSEKGTVEMVGLRSTRIRTLDRTLVSIPNRKIVDGSLNNVSVRPNTRIKFMLGLHHGTSVDAIEQMIANTKRFILDHPSTSTENYLYINQIQDQGVYVLVQYYVNSLDSDIIWQTQQDVNVFILKQTETLGIAFAEVAKPA